MLHSNAKKAFVGYSPLTIWILYDGDDGLRLCGPVLEVQLELLFRLGAWCDCRFLYIRHLFVFSSMFFVFFCALSLLYFILLYAGQEWRAQPGGAPFCSSDVRYPCPPSMHPPTTTDKIAYSVSILRHFPSLSARALLLSLA